LLLREETTDLLQRLSLDSQPKPADATQPAAATAKKVTDKKQKRSWLLVLSMLMVLSS
jgi:hypothetical protein